MSTQAKPLITIAVIGESGVGKTTFIDTLASGTHGSTEYTTLGRFITQKEVEFAEAKILFWEVGWSFRDGNSDQLNLDRANGIILMYDIWRWSTFAALVNTICILQEDVRDKSVMLVGGKLDCDGVATSKVSRRNGEALAKDQGAIFFQICARRRPDVKAALDTLANTMYGGVRPQVQGERSSIETRNEQVGNSSMTTVQISLAGPNPQTRSLTADLQVLTSLRIIRERIRQLFPSLLEGNFTLTSHGRDGETIVIASDAELAVAHSNIDNNCLRLLVSPVEVTQRHSSTSSNTGVLHPGIICDMCNKILRGVRYKCLQCEDYDMCEACYAKKTHMQHDILKLVKPADSDGEPIALSTDTAFLEKIKRTGNDNLKRYALAMESEKLKPLNRRIHHAITCDMCHTTPVRGTRYKCLLCEDYDMCETCYEKKTHEGHDMLKLVNPRVAPRVHGLRGINNPGWLRRA